VGDEFASGVWAKELAVQRVKVAVISKNIFQSGARPTFENANGIFLI
jgi:hypothetical protein